MCTVLFAYKEHPKYPLIILSNRDESYQRPSLHAHHWKHNPLIFGGIDLKAGGTWLAVSKKARFAFITNYRDLSKENDGRISRGFLPRDYLLSELNPYEYMQSIQANKEAYNPFNLIVGDMNTLYYYSNVQDMIVPIQKGYYGLSNGLLGESWPKVNRGVCELESATLHSEIAIEDFFNILSNTHTYDFSILPKTGIDADLEEALSSIFIALDQYGTRYQSIVLIDQESQITFYEKSMDHPPVWESRVTTV